MHSYEELYKIVHMKKRYQTSMYDRVSSEKKERIITVALEEFANKGFSGANTNIIAKNAGISVGSLFKYFETKENLFLTIVEHGVSQLEFAMKRLQATEGDLLGKVETLLRIVLTHTRQNQNIIKLYNEMTSEGNAELMRKVSKQMESVAMETYISLFDQAKSRGEISSEIPSNVLAFAIDSLMMIVQFSYASEYYQERLMLYFGDDIFENDEALIQGLLQFIIKSITP